MSEPARSGEERLLELLAARALDDLSPGEEHELAELRGAFPQILDDELDRMAALIVLAHLPHESTPLPAELKGKIASAAAAHFASPDTLPISRSTSPRTARVSNRRELLAWAVAAAAILCAVGIGWWNRGSPARLASPEELRNRLLAAGGDVLQVPWQPGKHPLASPVAGDVVYSVGKQEGYLHFHGLPANDPRKEQYQLWIIDPSRDDEPIDGGVFDASGAADIVIPVQAKLRVGTPQAFAITIEKPGGVVVSKQERLPLLAAVSK